MVVVFFIIKSVLIFNFSEFFFLFFFFDPLKINGFGSGFGWTCSRPTLLPSLVVFVLVWGGLLWVQVWSKSGSIWLFVGICWHAGWRGVAGGGY